VLLWVSTDLVPTADEETLVLERIVGVFLTLMAPLLVWEASVSCLDAESSRFGRMKPGRRMTADHCIFFLFLFETGIMVHTKELRYVERGQYRTTAHSTIYQAIALLVNRMQRSQDPRNDEWMLPFRSSNFFRCATTTDGYFFPLPPTLRWREGLI
jgi:hypothetical protein